MRESVDSNNIVIDQKKANKMLTGHLKIVTGYNVIILHINVFYETSLKPPLNKEGLIFSTP